MMRMNPTHSTVRSFPKIGQTITRKFLFSLGDEEPTEKEKVMYKVLTKEGFPIAVSTSLDKAMATAKAKVVPG